MSTAPAVPSASSRRLERVVPVLIALLALAIRLHRIDWGLPSVYEEAVPLKKAWDMWGFGPMGEFSLNPHWFQYPSLMIDLQWLGSAFTSLLLRVTGAARSANDLNVIWLTDPTPFYAVGRGITALFGAATVLPTWAFARRVSGPVAAAAAALCVALHPGLVAKSQVIEVDVPLVFFMAFVLVRALAHAGGASRRDWIVTGALAGLATSAKYPGLVLVLPIALAAWWAASASRPRAARASAPAAAPRAAKARGRERAPSPRPAAAPSALPAWIASVATAGVALAAAFVLTSPYMLLDPKEAQRDLAIGRQLMTLGHFGVEAGAAYATYAKNWFTSFLGLPLGVASLTGLAWFAAVRRERWALLLASLAVPFLLVVGSWQMKADRYLLPMVPVAAILGAAAFDAIGAALAPRARALAHAVPALGALACVAPLALMLPAHWRTLGTDTRDLARQWIERNLPAHALVVSEMYGPELLAPIKLLAADGDVMAQVAKRSGARPVYAVQTMPMFVVGPERAVKYYALPRLALADAFVVTGSIRERYRGEPARYAHQIAFYDSLEARWPKAAHFEPNGGPGPAIDVYRNPDASAPFGARPEVLPADSAIATTDPLTGAEAFWYVNMGLNHELAGHDASAEACYRFALRFGRTEPVEFQRAALLLANLHDEQGRREEALRVLDRCARIAPSRGIAETLQRGRERLARGLPVSVKVRP